ncbi:ATP synthase subunit I [Alteromonas lipotrueae]|uniref:ATP synthase subunit I n=1 Tax=Alteromonas lipotrueae TaxID=2803814 RepID=UPI001C45AD03|nr:ATP synthase subunit I [Alteromonas lipotrueae]
MIPIENLSLTSLILPFLIGTMLGCCFFYALWFTVKKGMNATQPALWFLSSLLLRMGTAISVFYWVGNNDIWRLSACLAGFVIGRILMTTITNNANPTGAEKGALHHAP